MKTKLFFAFIFFVSTFNQLLSQEDAYKALLKRSSVCVHKAQKQMLASKKTDLGGKLAKAVLLQSYAVKLYAQKKEAEAACVSLHARQLAFEIIKETSAREDTYSLATEEEKKLIAACSDEITMIKESKKALPAFSEKDTDYNNPKSLNETNVDIR
ncbi:MAG TPA: hypothetical protein VNZ49_06565 [Bacteroidia bacterium]|jgi:hypothetical protein|nr:hypothetical protein [Bacteroidia bacterium]